MRVCCSLSEQPTAIITSTQTRTQPPKMSPSSTGDSPPLPSGTNGRQFPLSARENFTIEMPSSLAPMPNGNSILKSPSDLKAQRTSSFSRDGILGAAQKARHLSQSSEALSNGALKDHSDDNSNPLKRRNTDAGVDYPRRRATIAVCHSCTCIGARLDADLFTVRGLPI